MSRSGPGSELDGAVQKFCAHAVWADIFSGVLLGALTLATISIVVSTLRIGISPMPSTPAAHAAMLAAIPAEFAGTIVELGSGFGTLSIAAARKFPKAQVVAYEAALVPYLIGLLLKQLSGTANVRCVRADFKKVDLGAPQIALCYLFPRGMKALAEKLQHTRGLRLISNTFVLPGHEPTEVTRLRDLYSTPIYVYRL